LEEDIRTKPILIIGIGLFVLFCFLLFCFLFCFNFLPFWIIGTHADKLSKQELAQRLSVTEKLYPKSINPSNPNQIVGHMVIALSSSKGIQEVKNALLEIAHSHPKIGIGKVKIPKSMLLIQDIIRDKRKTEPYLTWSDYTALHASGTGIFQTFLNFFNF
jgi:hypothetical protein